MSTRSWWTKDKLTAVELQRRSAGVSTTPPVPLGPGEPVVGLATGSLSRIRSSAVVVAGRIVSDSRRMSSPRWLISWLRAVERRIATTTGRRVALRSVRSISACRSCVRFVLVLDRQDCSCRRPTGVEHLDPADVRGGADQETRTSLPPSTPAARSPSMPSCPREQATRVGYAGRHGRRDVHPPADSGSWGEFID